MSLCMPQYCRAGGKPALRPVPRETIDEIERLCRRLWELPSNQYPGRAMDRLLSLVIARNAQLVATDPDDPAVGYFLVPLPGGLIDHMMSIGSELEDMEDDDPAEDGDPAGGNVLDEVFSSL
jgi:hypothetical protein